MKRTSFPIALVTIMFVAFPLVSEAQGTGIELRTRANVQVGSSSQNRSEAGVGIQVQNQVRSMVNASSSVQLKATLQNRLELMKQESQVRQKLREQQAEQRREHMEARMSLVASSSASSTARADFKAIAGRQALNVFRVLSATVLRLEQIIDRIESRIAKVEANGGVTAEAKTNISAAKNHLVEAEVKIKLLSELDLTGENAREVFGQVRAAAAEAKTHIRLARASLMMAVRSLNMSGTSTSTATSTATSTQN